MPNEELISYVVGARKEGIEESVIRLNLQSGGWSEKEINDALRFDPLKDQELLKTLPQNIYPHEEEPKDHSNYIIISVVIVFFVVAAIGVWYGIQWINGLN